MKADFLQLNTATVSYPDRAWSIRLSSFPVRSLSVSSRAPFMTVFPGTHTPLKGSQLFVRIFAGMVLLQLSEQGDCLDSRCFLQDRHNFPIPYPGKIIRVCAPVPPAPAFRLQLSLFNPPPGTFRDSGHCSGRFLRFPCPACFHIELYLSRINRSARHCTPPERAASLCPRAHVKIRQHDCRQSDQLNDINRTK